MVGKVLVVDMNKTRYTRMRIMRGTRFASRFCELPQHDYACFEALGQLCSSNYGFGRLLWSAARLNLCNELLTSRGVLEMSMAELWWAERHWIFGWMRGTHG